jgi:hypothetical protein
MKVTTGRFGRAKTYVGRLPTHGVYYLRVWDLMGERADEFSLHWTFESAVDVAAREELEGRNCVVVCFDPPANAGERSVSSP